MQARYRHGSTNDPAQIPRPALLASLEQRITDPWNTSANLARARFSPAIRQCPARPANRPRPSVGRCQSRSVCTSPDGFQGACPIIRRPRSATISKAIAASTKLVLPGASIPKMRIRAPWISIVSPSATEATPISSAARTEAGQFSRAKMGKAKRA